MCTQRSYNSVFNPDTTATATEIGMLFRFLTVEALAMKHWVLSILLISPMAQAYETRSEEVVTYKVARGIEKFPVAKEGLCAGMVTVPLEDEDGRSMTLQCRKHVLQVNVAAYATCVFTTRGTENLAYLELFSPEDCAGFVKRLKTKIENGNRVVIAKYVTTNGHRAVTNLFAVQNENDMPSWDPRDQNKVKSTDDVPTGTSR